MSCKSRGKESEIESVQSHQETSELIEKGVKYFSRTRTGKRPAIYFKIAASGTESKKNLKVIYREIEPLHFKANSCRFYLAFKIKRIFSSNHSILVVSLNFLLIFS